MPVLAPPLPSRPAAPPPGPAPRTWTASEFHALRDAGWFADCKAILIDGAILTMPIPGPRHNVAVTLADYALKALFAAGFVVRVQMPLVLSQTTDPLPDSAVVPGAPRDYFAADPTSALLVVEAADSTLSFDEGAKASLYAAGGIADYWVIDLVNARLTVFRDPGPDPAAPHGGRYRSVTRYAAGQAVAPLVAPQSPVAVADLLP